MVRSSQSYKKVPGQNTRCRFHEVFFFEDLLVRRGAVKLKIYYFHEIFHIFLVFTDAEVNGGTAMYERAFINDQYEEAHPEDMEKIDRLKDLMATQIPLLSIGLQ